MKRKLADYTEREKEAAKGNESPAAIRAVKAKGCTDQLLLLLLLLLLLFSAFIHFAQVCSRLRYNPPPHYPISQMTSFALIRKMPPRFFSKLISSKHRDVVLSCAFTKNANILQTKNKTRNLRQGFGDIQSTKIRPSFKAIRWNPKEIMGFENEAGITLLSISRKTPLKFIASAGMGTDTKVE